MRKTAITLAASFVLVMAGAAQAANGTVKVTPLGSHDGEFCALDRALLFEDPDGTRILYDAGRTVRGPEDPRLGKIDVVLLSHVHGDHEVLGGTVAARLVPERGAPERHHLGDRRRARDDEQALNGRRAADRPNPRATVEIWRAISTSRRLTR